MKIGHVLIQQTFAQTGIRNTPAILNVDSEHADLNLNQKPARLRIQQIDAELTVDSSGLRRAFQMHSPVSFAKELGSEGLQAGIVAIGKISAAGDDMARIELGRDPKKVFADLVKRESIWEDPAIKVVDPTINNGIHIEISPGSVKVDYLPGEISLEAIPHKPALSFQRGEIKVYLQQNYSVDIDSSLRPIDFKI
ncbi:DUF6470 family protein [Effusibacillus lacus]|uniref:Uncharacterized protein n=1 Tax=Effusibacillus lacus TaxID=1348429 RepID=A0A292YFL9_9BACL|nr:DUF6470 family protein [Effusibacillus lacus]TCS69815.1 hypothetical protein EDD64_13547 [Effusibacillus lacus]GAX88897.1 hypothetical protein EFBL_0511 [Effusibacillus lacus]